MTQIITIQKDDKLQPETIAENKNDEVFEDLSILMFEEI